MIFIRENCRLCQKYKSEGSIIFENNNFWIAPALGQIVEGYLLISTKKCYIGLSELPKSLLDELEILQKKVRKILLKYYTEPIFFEHGAIASHRKGGCCIEHAHIHVVPIDIDLFNDISRYFRPKKIKKLRHLTQQFSKQIPYIYYENQTGNKYLFELYKPIPSQYLRRLIALKLNNPEKYDWRLYPEIDKFNKTFEKLSGKF